MSMLASAPRPELLALDDAEEWADPLGGPTWRRVVQGRSGASGVQALVLALLPVAAGPGRFVFASRVSVVDLEDGRDVFDVMHRSLTVKAADADAGWRAVASAVGLTDAEVDAALAAPCAEAEDLVAVVRDFGYRSAHEGAGVAWALERRWPRLCGELAGALAVHHGVDEVALVQLRDQEGQAAAVAERCDRLVARYLREPWEVFEGRRAAREALWALTALLESVEVQ